ncbi:uncharacterized protein DC041_0007671 [Schistosoma bovis]|uniref:UBA domain-containing protein n=1 Tax=Schistosoma bovis TaxID=6184 RepID=A0A430Q607_SCHBO|nr:uncharacterized protein DC041_0007671 [Schistosoma bovis]
MSEPREHTNLDFFNLNLGSWNNGSGMELVDNDIWPPNSDSYLAHTKLGNMALPAPKKPEKLTVDSKPDPASMSLLGLILSFSVTWSNNPLRLSNKMSIWSSDMQVSEVKSSGNHNQHWGSSTKQSVSLVYDDVWDSSHDPVFQVPRVTSDTDPWKLSPTHCIGSLTNAPITIADPGVLAGTSRSSDIPHDSPANSLPYVTAMLSGLNLTPRNPDEPSKLYVSSLNNLLTWKLFVSASDVKSSIVCANMNDVAFSAEQLCDRLINTNEGWGRRPIDQATPWEPLDPKLGDQVNRSGITTPTPGACPSGFVSGSLRISHTHSADSNVWASGPPTGTGIWEMHYESLSGRSAVWQEESQSSTYRDASSVTHISPSTLINCNMNANSRGATPMPLNNRRDWEDNENTFRNSGNVQQSNGRPVLGSTRPIVPTHNPPDEFSWDPDPNFLRSGVNPNGIVSWDTSPNSVVSTTWGTLGTSSLISSTQTHFPPVSDDVRHQQNFMSTNSLPQGSERLLIHPYSNTYRADLVKYLMSQGFKREDAHAALIASNMEPDKAIVELRERYSTNKAINAMTQPPELNRNYGADSILHVVTRNGPMYQLSNHTSLSQFAPSGNNSSVSAQNHRLKQSGLCVSTQSNTTQLLSMQPIPNSQFMRQQITQQVRSALNLSIPSPLGVQTNGSATMGTCGGSLLGKPPSLSLSNVNSNIQTASSTNPHSSTSLLTTTSLCPIKNNRTSTGPASLNQNSAKRSPRQISIINSMIELQKKHQSIQHQLNMYHNNPALRSQPQYADVFVELQGQMQQIETQLHGKRAQLNITRAQDSVTQSVKNPLIPTNASKLNNFTRTPSCKISGSWSPTWSSSVINPSCPNIRSIHNQWQLIHNQQRCALESNLKFPVSKNNPSSTLSIEAQGQWLLVQPLLGWNGTNIHSLQNILSNHFKLTSFHVLNPSSCSVLIRLQNIEDSLQLVKFFGDRLSVEPLSDHDARVHLQQLSLNACGDGLISNHFNTSSDIHATPPSLNSNGQFYSPMNSNNKKPNPHIARFGITVCGSK